VNYAEEKEEEQERKDEDVVVLSGGGEFVEDFDDGGILFDPSTRVSVHNGLPNCLVICLTNRFY
jgi:hypothetical protein